MKHLETIKAFLKTLMNSESFHALVVQSPPGWGKSTTIDLAFAELGVTAVVAGSYATPLHIYNLLCRNPDSIVILDDCAGLFSDPKSMAILKSATWESSGHGLEKKTRHISWGSTSEKVEQPSVDFSGKLVLLTNVVPAGKETEAFLSRCLSYRISVDQDEIKQMLFEAAKSQEYFPKTELALEVVKFLVDASTRVDLAKVNLRTLKMGYDLAATHPTGWRELFAHLLPKHQKGVDVVSQILQARMPVKEQEAQFAQATGKSRRSFYNYKKRLGLTRAYRNTLTR